MTRSHVQSVELNQDAPQLGFPFELGAVRAIHAIAFAPVTIFAGDNGSGKSTITEAIAVAAGMNPEGGSMNLRFTSHENHSDLHRHLTLRWTHRPTWGWFLRAESFYAMATHIDDDSSLRGRFPMFHQESHGESFLDLAFSRFQAPGFYVLDEPESALSIQGQMALVRIIAESVEKGSQFIIATHSPFLIAFPGATLHEFDTDGISRREFDDATAIQLWRRFLADPATFYDRLLVE